MRVTSLVAVLCAFAASAAHADRVHLVGGTVIEGKATRAGDRIVVEIGSGEVVLSAVDVERIERGDSDIERIERRQAKLLPGDVKGMLELADFCRDHDMRDRERQLLVKVIEVSPNHAQARARLGYVRAASGAWIPREEHLRAQGLVEHQGQWVTREQLAQLERARAEADRAAHERDQAKVQLEKQRVELQRARESAPAPAGQLTPPTEPTAATPASQPMYYSSPYPSASHDAGWRSPRSTRSRAHPTCSDGLCGHPTTSPDDPRKRPFPIPGVRDPFDYLR